MSPRQAGKGRGRERVRYEVREEREIETGRKKYRVNHVSRKDVKEVTKVAIEWTPTKPTYHAQFSL